MGSYEKNIENLLKKSKTVDSANLAVDSKFKESLREELYKQYLNNISHNGIMAKIKQITINWKMAVLYGIGFIILGGVAVGLVMSRGGKSLTGDQEVLIAANLAFVDGEVQVKRAGEDRWVEALQGDVLEEDDSLKTAEESRAVLVLDTNDAVRLNADTEVKLDSMDPEDVVIAQAKGETYCRVDRSEENKYTIKGMDVEAEALGTAYVFNTNEEEKQVTVYVHESTVNVKSTEEKDVGELNKAIVNVEDGAVEVSPMTEEEYNTDFAKWNKEKDVEQGYELPGTEAPVVKITAPENGKKVTSSSVAVKGTVDSATPLKKITVNGKVYEKKGADGKGFDPATGEFHVDVALKNGENKITVIAYNTYWTASEAAVVAVTKEASSSDGSTPPVSSYFTVTSVTATAKGTITVNWAMSGYSAPYGFKVIRAAGHVPQYPGDSIRYVSDGNARSTIWGQIPGGTYNVNVCIYNGSGGCTMYTSNYKTVTVEEAAASYPDSVTLTSVSEPVEHDSKYKVIVDWSISGPEASKGFKVCKAVSPSTPSYPGDCVYVSAGTRSAVLTGLAAGTTYNFRVGVYNGSGGCVMYSNMKSATTP